MTAGLRIAAVAVNTFREAVRDRVLYALLGVASLLLVFTLALAELSLDQKQRIVMDVGLASISFFAVVVSIFLGSSLLYKEIERKTLYVILPKPLRRAEFLLGKYFGIVLTALVFVAIMGAVQLLVASIQAGASSATLLLAVLGLLAVLALALWRARDRTWVIVPWSLLALGVSAWVSARADVGLSITLAALCLSMGEVLVLAAVAIFFSSFSTPFLTAVFTAGIWVAGRSTDSMITMKEKALPDAVRGLLHALAEVLPNFSWFVPGRHTLATQLDEVAGPLSYVVNTLGYAAGYSLVLLVFAALIFQRRDFL